MPSRGKTKMLMNSIYKIQGIHSYVYICVYECIFPVLMLTSCGVIEECFGM